MRLSTKVILIIGCLVTTLISVLFLLLLLRINKQNEENMLTTAEALFDSILITRKWVSDFDGVFVNKQPGMEPNPFLPHPELITNTGDTLLLKNPALVTRELSEMSKTFGGSVFSYHLASEKYINPVNAPDSFELEALNAFKDSTTTKIEKFYQIEKINGKSYFRYFSPLYVDLSCLNCHSGQGYEYGDLRGGISVLLLIDSYLEDRNSNLIFLVSFALITIALMSAFIFGAIQKTVIKPVRQIEESTHAMREGNFAKNLEINSKDEIGSLAKSFNVMSRKIQNSTNKLKLSENKYRSLIENSIESIAIIDNVGKIKECNNKLSHLTGYDESELITCNLYDLIDQNKKRDMGLSSEKAGKKATTEHYETILSTKDNLEIPIEVYRIKEFSFDKKSKLSIIYIRDLSERKQIEKYSIQSEKMYALGQLSSGIAHEIRNPLFALNNNIEYLNQNISDDQTFTEIYPELKTSIDRIHKTVSTILDFSRKQSTEKKDVNINNVLDQSIILVKKQFAKSSVTIDLKLDKKIRTIRADSHQLEQVFVNLFLNSFQAIGNNRGTIYVSTKHYPKFIEIVIKDTGKGIPKDELERIFDPFFSTFTNGTGLGLTIVQRALDYHDATYTIKSEEFVGTTFTIRFRY